jgi:hypothetical protein
MGAWVVAVLVLGLSLGAGAQNSAGRELPAAPTPGSATPLPAATAATAPTATVQPELPAVYTPLTADQKFHIFVQQTYSIYTVANTAFDAGWAQLTNDWPAYGQGAEGYGKRYGALLANHEAGSFFENFLFPTVLHQDPRYFRMGQGHSLFARVPYAMTRVLVTRSDSGHHTFNSSLLLGLLFVDGLTNAYYPRPQRGFGETMSRFGGGVLSSAETNLLREFMPDMLRIFRKHEPEKLKKLEQLEKKVPLVDKLSQPNNGIVQSPDAQNGASNPPANPAGKPETGARGQSSAEPAQNNSSPLARH